MIWAFSLFFLFVISEIVNTLCGTLVFIRKADLSVDMVETYDSIIAYVRRLVNMHDNILHAVHNLIQFASHFCRIFRPKVPRDGKERQFSLPLPNAYS